MGARLARDTAQDDTQFLIIAERGAISAARRLSAAMTNLSSNPRRQAGDARAGGGSVQSVHSVRARRCRGASLHSLLVRLRSLFGYSSAAWAPFGNAGSAYEACPTGGGSTAGVSNRLIGTTYTGYSHSGHVFTAPPGATITHVRWAGRMARDNCRWGSLHSSRTERGADHGNAARRVLRRDSFRQPRLADDIRGTRGHDPRGATGLLRRPPMPPRGDDARAPSRGDGGRPDPAVDFPGRPAGERAVGERSSCAGQTL